jgi:hypothetical protein
MINPDHLPQALKALQRLIIHSKGKAYGSADNKLAELLNDMELLPEFLAEGEDRTAEFVEMLQGIARMHPDCRYIVEEFSCACLKPEAMLPVPPST